MKRLFALLLLMPIAASTAKAENFTQLKEHYDTLSPLSYPVIPQKQVVEVRADAPLTEEEQLAETKAKELEEKKSQEEKAYLDTDQQFFKSLNVTLDEDELDKAYQEKQAAENIEKLKATDQTVKTEIVKTAPALITRTEGAKLDEKRNLILKQIADNGKHVRACILQYKNEGEFKGTAMTLAWEVEASGRVLNPKLKATDIENLKIQECVLKSLAEWNFGEAMKIQAKNSHVEYTYRFVNASAEVPVQKPRTAELVQLEAN